MADAILDELQEQVRRSGQSISALSEAIGRNRGWLGNHLRCRTVPNMVDLIMIADKAGFDVKKLIPKLQEHEDAADNFVVDGVRDLLTRRSFKRPDPHDVFRWHLENGGQLRNHEWFEDYYELFEMPDVQNIKVRPIYMGRLSIAATVLNLESVNGLLTFFDRLKDKELREIVAEHAQVLKTQKSSIATRTAHYHITAGHEATMEYIRILLPVREGKKDLVMNYSVTTELRETFKRTTDMEVLDISSLKFSIA
ncbi:MAG: hypothetical protein AAF557_11135 [Pseudomonadota bacterium]